MHEETPTVIKEEQKISLPKKEKEESLLKEMFRFALIVFLVILPIRMFIAQPFVVSGASMEPTFLDGEYLIVDELSYRFAPPKRGDVIIFKFPGTRNQYLIKRIIALPGETISIKNNVVSIKNDANPEGIILEESYLKNKMNRPEEIVSTLGATEYFVMGDNRPQSADSRLWGPLQKERIVGRPLVRLLPVSKLDMFPGIEIPMPRGQ